MKILIGGAWPYANGSLHIGHIASLLPGDVLARYHRAAGNEVYYVSGSDCHGTPVAIRARQESKSPRAVSDYYHAEFAEVFGKLGFSYDLYGKTSDAAHVDFVQAFHKTMYENEDSIYEKSAPQAHCPCCNTVLADRLVVGQCPSCGARARGDQCDACGHVPEPEALQNPQCAACGTALAFYGSKHLYIAISKLAAQLQAYLDAHSITAQGADIWRKNAIAFTKRYIDEGLRDRAITRALDWGIDVPKEGFADKKIYIWAENVLGYLSMSHAAARTPQDFNALWHSGDALHYYVHGKDNIPFHTIILPALLLAHGGGWRLPDVIVSGEHLTLEKQKISTSQNWAIWAKDIVNRYHPDSLRYYFIACGPEKRDSDFSWSEYVNCHNNELLGAYGNFVNRSLVFIQKFQNGVVPEGTLPPGIANRIAEAFASVGAHLHAGRCKDALGEAFALVREANKHFDDGAPWKTRTDDPAACAQTLFTCVQLIANLSVLLEPFLPFSSSQIRTWLGIANAGWQPQNIRAGYALPEIGLLFERLDKSVVDAELAALHGERV